MLFVLFCIIGIVLGAYFIQKNDPADPYARFVFKNWPIWISIWVAIIYTKQFVAVDPSIHRDIPWVYMRFWALVWWLYALILLFPRVRGMVWFSTIQFFQHLLKFWGPRNAPFWCWIGLCVFSTVMLFIQGLPTLGPDLEESWAWVKYSYAYATSLITGDTVTTPALSERFPRTWLWLWLTPIALVMIPVSFVLVHWDDLKRAIVSIWTPTPKVVGVGEEEAEVEEGEERRPRRREAPPTKKEGLGAWYWTKHIVQQFFVEVFSKALMT